MNENKKLMSGIKSKLLAAVCMLLVAVIMVVSSTYAWFTLSTAPEVTGITTAVGANGALEMLLLTKDDAGNWVYNEDMVAAGDDSNTYWGNIVDLKDNTKYGLDKIALYPSTISLATGHDVAKKGAVLNNWILNYPDYGPDGRVTALGTNTVTGTFVNSQSFIPDDHAYGVRAVGTSSGLTNRQLAYRNAKSQAGTATSSAKSKAQISLNTYGSDLANIAIKRGMNSNATFTVEEITPLYNITLDLLADNGALEQIEKAYMQYIIALSASAGVGVSDEAELLFSIIEGYYEDANTAEDLMADTPVVAIATFLESLEDHNEFQLNSLGSISAYITELQETIADVHSAYKTLNGAISNKAPDTEVAWNIISDAINLLVNTDSLILNDEWTVSAIQNNPGGFASSAMKGITVTMKTGAGVYADIADHCGDYSSSIVIKEVSYSSIHVENLPASMETDAYYVDEDTKGSDPHLGLISKLFAAATEGEGIGSPEKGEDTNMAMSEFYGYIIDLAFRTNAANSSLLLQTNAKDRIYADNSPDAETAGHGSNMTFSSMNLQEFTNEDVANLMDCLRIVFFEEVVDDSATTKQIIATARLDIFQKNTDGSIKKDDNGNPLINYTVTGDGVRADMYLYETIAVTKYTVTTEEGGTPTSKDYYVYTEGEGENIKYKNFENDEDITAILFNGDALNSNVSKATESINLERKLTGTNAVIKNLTQNLEHNIHVLVYLEGKDVTNADVAATVAQSMKGSMNLQFASSATLVPMEYADLHQPNTESGTEG